jgi:hypothetical protein
MKPEPAASPLLLVQSVGVLSLSQLTSEPAVLKILRLAMKMEFPVADDRPVAV